MTKVEQHNAHDKASNIVVEYTYDAMNHRIEKISYTSETPVKTQYAYGRSGALTYQKKISGESVTTRSFVYLNNQIAGFMDKDENGVESIRYTVTDIQGTVTEIYDENYNLLWKSDYTAFGIKAGETTKLLDFDGLYTGCDYDAETGLSYHWNRWRSEDGDSWLSQDPARDGLNWYGYAGQNPVNFSDNTGLFYYTPEGQKSSLNYSTSTSTSEKKSSSASQSKTSNEKTKTTKETKETKEKTEAKAPNLTTNGNLCGQFNTITINGKNIIPVCINDAKGFDAAANAYLGVLKYGAAGNSAVDTIALTDSKGRIIHTFSNDKAIKNYALSLNSSNGNLLDAMGIVSTTTGILSDITGLPILKGSSTTTGAIVLTNDIIYFDKSHPVSGVMSIGIDLYGFTHPLEAYILAETKKTLENTANDTKQMIKDYQLKSLINSLTPQNCQQNDYSYMFMTELKIEMQQIIRGK